MNWSTDVEFEDEYKHRRKIETAAEATRILNEGHSTAYPMSEHERRESLAQLSELMAAIAERLHSEDVTWDDIAYQGAVAEREGLFSRTIHSSEMLSHIFTQSVKPDYLDARTALKQHFEQARFSLHMRVVGDEAASAEETEGGGDEREEPPY